MNGMWQIRILIKGQSCFCSKDNHASVSEYFETIPNPFTDIDFYTKQKFFDGTSL